MRNQFYRALTVAILIICPVALQGQSVEKLSRLATDKMKDWKNPVREWRFPSKMRVDSIKIATDTRTISLYFPVSLSYNPFREETVSAFKSSISKTLGRKFRTYDIRILTNGFTAEQLIPNYYRSATAVDTSRIPRLSENRPVPVKKVNGITPSKGLFNRNIALWHSHGYYFDMTLDRWEWQRARLFGTVEDISVMGYVLPYLTRMLEDAGATVFLPRERDTQHNEVIVDNDLSSVNSEFVIHINNGVEQQFDGFLKCDTLFPGDNPFRKGKSLRISGGTAEYVPDIPENGEYAVYVSYPRLNDNSKNVKYTIRHTGGSTEFIVDQTIGGGTWLWLGVFRFNKGKNASSGSVVVSNETGGNIALDAVRFGGGMGNIARRPAASPLANQWSLNEDARQETQKNSADTVNYTWKISGKPRYLEGARYFLQYAGMPDTLVFSLNDEKNDYNDDYQSRGAWVNYLKGSIDDSVLKGLGIPLDLSLAFHTDAGITPDDSIIGTLGIYSTAAGEGKFPDGKSRMASRDLTDLIQTQVVNDIATLLNPEWTRRGIWDKSYSEARRPEIPAMLLELLSHQNQGDQQYGEDPRFRFTVCRAVYKGMLRFLSYNEGRDYVVEPLPVDNLSLTPVGGKKVRLSWEPTTDPLEPTATPSGYKVYMREGDNGFDNGINVSGNYTEIELPSYDKIYSFKVTAINDGGESFDSEILAVGLKDRSEAPVLIVNGFDRISGPAWFDREGMAGVEWWNDRGVADHYEINATGDQYDFYRKSPWTDDDNPGWGASYGDIEGTVIPGNTFDYPLIHGKAIMAAGRSFCSVSDEIFCSDSFDMSQYKIVDLIFGEEKTTASTHDTAKLDYSIYTPGLIKKLSEADASGVSVLMSGSYLGTDLQVQNDTVLLKDVKEYLHFKPRTGHAVRNGGFYSTDIASPFFKCKTEFNTSIKRGDIYAAESPDAIEPADKSALTAFRYSENNTSAGVIHSGKNRTVVLGFPFETIIDEPERNALMKQILKFLTVQ